MAKALKIILKITGILLAVILAAALIYVIYMFVAYSRIEDNQSLSPKGAAPQNFANTNESYTVVTQNAGFGAYTADYTFFMDGGTESWAKSKESVIWCIDEAAKTAAKENPDFILFQEVDTDSTRSHHVNEYLQLEGHFADYQSVSAVNYHSAFLMYPFYQPHGSTNSCMVTFSRFGITSAVRRSLPISTSVSKFVDLDRCYSVSRIPVENGRELVLYNVHLSAYGGSDEIRTAQMNMLFSDMKAEYDAGNYCVCGGDFNHDFTGDSTQTLNGGGAVDFGWAQPFPAELLPQGISQCIDYTAGEERPTCRNCDIPYVDGNFTIIVDGFLASDNVTVTRLENIQTGFAYADHNPVVMSFTLNEE